MDDEVAALRKRCALLERRVKRFENTAFYVLAGASLIALVVSVFTPFIRSTDGAETVKETLTISSAISELPAAGNGPFEEQALMAGVFVGLYLVLVLLALVAVILMMAKASAKRYNFALVSSVLLLIGSGVAYLLVAIVAGRFNTSTFSPAVILTAIAAIFVLISAGLGRYILDQNDELPAVSNS